MTRMGLRNLVCVISSGSTTEASSSERSCGSEQAEGDQEYSPSSEGAAATAAAAPSLSSKCMNSSSSRESWHGGGHDHHGRASAAATVAHEPVSPASGGNHMFSCFHACAINLVRTHLLMNPLSSTNFFVFVFFSFPSHLLTELSGATSATSSSSLYKLLFGGVHGIATKSFFLSPSLKRVSCGFLFFLLLVSHLLHHHDESHRRISISKTSFFWTNKKIPDFY